MATQYIEDPQTKERIPFEWSKSTPPSSAEIDSLFKAARSQWGSSKKWKEIGGDLAGGENAEIGPEQATTGQRVAWAVAPYARPILEGGGATAAGILAAPAAVASGPGAPVVEAGAVGLGYLAGKQAADRLDEYAGLKRKASYSPNIVRQAIETGKEAVQEIPEAAIVGMSGPVIGKAAGLVKTGLQKLGPTKTAIQQEAGNKLAGSTTTGLAYTENANASRELEEKIPGLKFTRGQLSNDASAITLERALARKSGDVARLSTEQRAYANRALQDYYRGNLQGGEGEIGDFVSAVRVKQAGLEQNLGQLEISVSGKVSELDKAMSVQETGKSLVNTARSAKTAARNKASALFKKIPKDTEVGTEPLLDSIKEVRKEFNPNLENPENYPGKQINGVIDQLMVKPKPAGTILDASGNPVRPASSGGGFKETMSFEDLTKLRSTINDEIRAARGGANPNVKLTRRLENIRDGIEKTINQLEGAEGEVGHAYREAAKFYRKGYIEPYRQGAVADILQKGTRGEDTRIALANIGQKFWTRDGADQFVKALGDNQLSRQAMKDYASYDLLNNAVNPTTGKLDSGKVYRWFSRNREVLRKLNIEGDFKGLASSQRAVDAAHGTLDVFNKSVASRVLGAEPEKAIAQAFGGAGSKNTSQAARELLDLAKGNKAATEGLKKGFADFFFQKSLTTGVDTLENPVVSVAQMTRMLRQYEPALREIYRGEPQKLRALSDIWKSYRILNRTVASPLGGGSDTAENLMNAVRSVASQTMSHSRLLNVGKAAWGKLKSYSDGQVNKLLIRATFDPDYADSLIAASQYGGASKGLEGSGRAAAGVKPVAPYVKPVLGYETGKVINAFTQGQGQPQ